ncbi:DUF1361 domain-containing protein [Dictyobacter aurantiacus]|uniref:DUF1361 domain-containing protein n=1 Tax=Dictyobacter aurantiacus TaxID=1936993 RepID=A0A401ZKL5_9CHLR|nr:DUF1361 domain-containing protein [Dictyobacter aurantiacus]GCE07399.1 hypothetical protein KDAU_47280 [Dictyobacter aurantiacus]
MNQHFELIITTGLLVPMLGSVVLFSLLTISLLFARARIYPYPLYKPMLLNLFLAWIPIVCVSLALFFFLSAGSSQLWLVILLLCIWFVFFPNSTYLVTEFHHLKEEVNTVPFWFDTIVILSLALCGVLLGSFSLLLVHRMLDLYLPPAFSWLIFIVYLFLSNVGIYIGRFLRFNSWDVLINPLGLARHVLSVFKDRQKARSLLLFSVLFTVFLLAFYVFLYSAVTPIIWALETLIRQYPSLPR